MLIFVNSKQRPDKILLGLSTVANPRCWITLKSRKCSSKNTLTKYFFFHIDHPETAIGE